MAEYVLLIGQHRVPPPELRWPKTYWFASSVVVIGRIQIGAIHSRIRAGNPKLTIRIPKKNHMPSRKNHPTNSNKRASSRSGDQSLSHALTHHLLSWLCNSTWV
jgi:hypothetical protein